MKSKAMHGFDGALNLCPPAELVVQSQRQVATRRHCIGMGTGSESDRKMEMETIGCIFCGTSGHPVVIRENGYSGRRCPTCRLIYVSPRPAPAVIETLYREDQARISARDLVAEAFVKRLFARHHLRLIRRLMPSGSLLEIGAGAGYFLSEAQRAGFEVAGIEINRSQAAFMRDTLGIPCEETPLHPGSFGGRTFDIIYLCNVISHLYHPIETFQAISERLNPGGLLVFETGNLGDVDSAYYTLLEHFDYPEHLFFFSEANVRQLVQRLGLELLDMHRYALTLQLLLSRLRQTSRQQDTTAPTTPPQATNGTDDLARLARGGFNLRQFLSYLTRYELGSILPKRGRPQTLLVLARKPPQARHPAS